MGLILGKISVETPKYQLILKTADYEIRTYPPSVLAEVTYDPALLGDRDGGFMILAKYIGAVGEPQNSRPEKIPMTAPVITHSAEKIDMTAPVVTSGGGGSTPITMQFVLPAKYARAEDAPQPTDERVRIREVGERKYGVVRFSGVATETTAADRAEKLRKSLERDGYKLVGEHVLARYNPPWTLPPLRTNEVMLPIE
ncbi:heme-binding-like protein At3g10130, chloroplastic [Phalaenopsis equestris]|uniref:heme-binding-like protein At3g10130, chloroplastic n=1 Tax=Phalaenopsis equestris TaxID=78828 RepID=UPI0009E2B2B6|nr:heme-binding-like protein At3g10130, chloroplastic [Phalaenopsis equestris]